MGDMKFTVSGLGPFPMSMLRFDQAWPATDVDANKIEATYQTGRSGRWEIDLYTASRSAPTHGRWDSFNCRVEE